jgi:hypothetical protein
MFQSDLVLLLTQWKNYGDEIILAGDFNENVYLGPVATALLTNELRMREVCCETTPGSFCL